ncbi:MAG: DUF5818 domain-containing protein [Thermoanaerobaculia bacterium]
MTTIKNRNLAKGLIPALLLSAALVPAAAMAAPSHGKGHPDKNVKQQQQRVVQQQKQVAKAQKQVAKQQRQVQKAQARPGKVVYVAPAAPRRTVVRQRVVTPAPRTVYVAPQARNRGRWEGWNRQYNRYGSNRFQLDGTFFDQQYGCALVRDHQGQVIPLVGNPGDLRRGEHLLLSGRVENGTVCGTAFRVFEVDRVWADASHRRLLYDSRSDGDYGRYEDRYDDRYDDRYGRNDDRYDDDRYDDRGRNERLVSVDGRIDRGSRCDTLRADNGDRYGLAGDLRDYRDGERVRVVGFLGGRSACGSRTIDVQEIRDR